MFLKNTSKGDIKLSSFEGYTFIIPPGISAIWTPAGEQLLKVHKVESSGGKDKYGFDNGHGLPALFESTEAAWKKDGKKLVRVERFQINFKLIPRASLMKLALQRGISHNRVSEYQIDELIDPETIANEINSLPIPDEVKYPENIEEDDKENDEE